MRVSATLASFGPHRQRCPLITSPASCPPGSTTWRSSPLEPAPKLSAPARQPGPAEARGHAAGVQVQAARRLQQDGATRRRQRPTRRDRRVGRQPRAGRRARRPEARLQGDHRDAGHHAADQGRRQWQAAAPRSCCTATPTTRPSSTRWPSRSAEGATFVHPYDDPDVIAGQGTIGMEILRQRTGPDRRHLRCHRRRRPDRRHRRLCQARCAPRSGSSASSPSDADAMTGRSRRGAGYAWRRSASSADGVAVKQVGEETFRLCRGAGRRSHARGYRRHLRGDQGRVRGHPLDSRAGRRAR